MAIKSLSIRIDDEMLDKLHYVADYEARSANSQILVLIRECIEKFEEKHITDWSTIKSNLRDGLRDYVYQKTKRNPMILPIIMEI